METGKIIKELLPFPGISHKQHMKLFTSFILTLLIISARGQDEALAKQYYLNGEFDKAVILYERVYTKKYDDETYENYLQSFLPKHKASVF